MDIEKIFKLLEAGFTKDEIIGLCKPNDTKPVQTIEPTEPTKPTEASQDTNSTDDQLNALRGEITALANAIHKQNIQATAKEDKPETPDDILKKLLKEML